jgi:hypothetical protein
MACGWEWVTSGSARGGSESDSKATYFVYVSSFLAWRQGNLSISHGLVELSEYLYRVDSNRIQCHVPCWQQERGWQQLNPSTLKGIVERLYAPCVTLIPIFPKSSTQIASLSSAISGRSWITSIFCHWNSGMTCCDEELGAGAATRINKDH